MFSPMMGLAVLQGAPYREDYFYRVHYQFVHLALSLDRKTICPAHGSHVGRLFHLCLRQRNKPICVSRSLQRCSGDMEEQIYLHPKLAGWEQHFLSTNQTVQVKGLLYLLSPRTSDHSLCGLHNSGQWKQLLLQYPPHRCPALQMKWYSCREQPLDELLLMVCRLFPFLNRRPGRNWA